MAFSFSAMLTAALNHLLEAEPALRARLAPFAGETLELRVAPLLPIQLSVAEGGRLEPASPDAASSLVITLAPGALAAALKGEEHFLRSVEISGNAQLAAEVMFLFRHLRWDAEEDLSRLMGDVAAHRVVGLARELAALHREAASRIAQGLVEYALEEKPLLVSRAGMQGFAGATARLRDDLERLEKRLERLERA